MKQLHTFKQFVLFFRENWDDHNIINLAAQLSYRILLAFIPFIMLIYNFLTLMRSSINITLLEQAKEFLPEFLTAFFETAQSGASGPQTSLWANLTFMFFMLFASVTAMRSLILVINKAMHCDPPHPNVIYAWLRSWFSALLYLTLLLFVVFFTGIFYTLTQTIAIESFDLMNLSQWFIATWKAFTLLYIFAIITLIFTAIYSLAPYPHLRFMDALPGALAASSLILIIWELYRIFLHIPFTFKGLSQTLQAPFTLIITIFVLSIITCFGCIVNAFFLKEGKEKRHHEKKNL